ncbi:hypothetical protein I302_100472 [Kwoniella bestiolae CBS 10118]|uniref:Uncharacterized protein n=1 Tax=Kwoniella bestiolae CBS 10118 TaxID=1296100 RepID=A0A1B9G556_9TREE|nr:hypothetical protein I302_03845 [Kwoniella bestiolae CBS 10118]OCF26167.1 hypothetical protein I302_03845 [Kwoniella bestiolae CBS 10118]
MMCIKHVLIYFLVLPIPAASPVFLLLFVASAFIAIRPCGYCLSLLAILFLSTSPHSPFLHPSLHSSSSTPNNSTSTTTSIYDLPLNAPSPNRTWLNLNGGRYSSPNLVGYELMDKAITSSNSKPSSTQSEDSSWKRFLAWDLGQSIYAQYETKREITGNIILDRIIQPYLRPPSSSPSSAVGLPSGEVEQMQWNKRALPRNYVDFSWKGVGFVLDFGLRRSDEGIKWEIEEVTGREWVRPTAEDDLQREDKEEEGVQNGNEEDRDKADEVIDGLKAETTEKPKTFWEKIPLVGSSW